MKAPNILLILLSAIIPVSCDREDLTSPVALFTARTTPIYMFKLTLDASGSFSTVGGDDLEYRWDINGDHLEWEKEWSSNPFTTVQFPFENSGYIGLQVKDRNGNITELYQGFYTDIEYGIIRPGTDLEIGFRAINFKYPDFHWSWIWAYDNIQLPDSDDWFNFESSDDRAAYGTLVPWDVADNLEKDYGLPSMSDWQKMISFCGGATLAGFNLQVRAVHGLQLSCAGIVINGHLQEHGTAGYYWTGNAVDADSAWALRIRAGSDEAEFVILDKTSMASVRLMMEFMNYR